MHVFEVRETAVLPGLERRGRVWDAVRGPKSHQAFHLSVAIRRDTDAH